jgi:hypothetical protein
MREPGGASSWPVGHVGWVFAGVPSFEGAVARFLAEGVPRRERLMFVADDPTVARWPRTLLDDGRLVVASVAETYGGERLVDPVAQHRTFNECLADALADGFSGLRVAADNTSLITTPEQLRAWMRWEEVADRFIAENPVVWLCAFDRTRVDDDVLSTVTGVHRVTRLPDGHDGNRAARSGDARHG